MKIFDYDGYPAVYLHEVIEKLPIQFKDCPVHTEIRFVDTCPVCEIALTLAIAQDRIMNLEFELLTERYPP